MSTLEQDHAPVSARRALGLTFVADLAVVSVFVTVGRSSHAEGITAAGLWVTGWPFVLGLLAGYVGVQVARLAPLSLRAGLLVGFKTVLVGMLLRSFAQDDGTPVSFVVVATTFVLGLMLAWRLTRRVLLRGRGGPGK